MELKKGGVIDKTNLIIDHNADFFPYIFGKLV